MLGRNPEMLIAGVDEAGRGCVIGPLVVAGILVKTENMQVAHRFGRERLKASNRQKKGNALPRNHKVNPKTPHHKGSASSNRQGGTQQQNTP